jgi:hypothetical protein
MIGSKLATMKAPAMAQGRELFFADAAANGELLSVRVGLSGATPELGFCTEQEVKL